MNAWTIYWILQLDSIGCAIGVISIVGAIAMVILFMIGAFEKSSSNMFPEMDASKRERARGEAAHRIAVRMAFFVTPLFLINAFIPSTRTAAAMVILPAIANNERIQHEAGDLYQLAKQALANAVAPSKPEKSK